MDKYMSAPSSTSQESLSESEADRIARIESADFSYSTRMAEETEPHIDLSKVSSDSEFLMAHLAARYEETMLPLISGQNSPNDQLLHVIRLLTRQLARAQADIYVLKSAVLGRDKLVLTRDWDYKDPLRSHLKAIGEDVQALSSFSLGRYVIEPEDYMVGYGWHDTEQREDSSTWRWSGPETKSGILLPNIMGGECSLQVHFRVLSRDVLPDKDMVSCDHVSTPYTLEWVSEDNGIISFDVSPPNDSTNFLVEFCLAKTVSPAELLGRYDKRHLGLCLRKFVFTKK